MKKKQARCLVHVRVMYWLWPLAEVAKENKDQLVNLRRKKARLWFF